MAQQQSNNTGTAPQPSSPTTSSHTATCAVVGQTASKPGKTKICFDFKLLCTCSQFQHSS